LPDGPVDIVGDIHGELEALEALLEKLGYTPDGSHPQGRRLVFVGDLIDRGPASARVVLRVKALVEAGYAFAILGNHELNLVRKLLKNDNHWFMSPDDAEEAVELCVDPAERAAVEGFLKTLPLVLEREDLRVVHACWLDDSIDQLRGLSIGEVDLKALHADYSKQLWQHMQQSGLAAKAAKEETDYAECIRDRNWQPEFLAAKAEADELFAVFNPLSVLTSGMERRTQTPFWASGKWRMVERVRWWDNYQSTVPVVVGHYWRRVSERGKVEMDKFGPDLFEGIGHFDWLGPNKNVFCVDYSVAVRPALRQTGGDLATGKLAALRFPECELVTDCGDEIEVGLPG
jgi:hypothetical protein